MEEFKAEGIFVGHSAKVNGFKKNHIYIFSLFQADEKIIITRSYGEKAIYKNIYCFFKNWKEVSIRKVRLKRSEPLYPRKSKSKTNNIF